MEVLVFDIETIPDIQTARARSGFSNLSDEQIAKALFSLQRQKQSSDFLPLHQHG